MIRFFSFTLLFIILVLLQTSLISSLSGILVFIPLFLAVIIFFVQQLGDDIGVLLLIGFGLYLDIFSSALFPLETVSFCVTSISVFFLSKHVFSNRSWYGLMASGITGIMVLTITRALVLYFWSFFHPNFFRWSDLWITTKWNGFLLLILLAIFFAFSRPIRSLLSSTFMIAGEKETY